MQILSRRLTLSLFSVLATTIMALDRLAATPPMVITGQVDLLLFCVHTYWYSILIFLIRNTEVTAVVASLSVALPARAGRSSGTASDSICPKGWRLPGYDGSGSWYSLVQSYNAKINANWNIKHIGFPTLSSPISLLLSGAHQYYSGKPWAQSAAGLYYSGYRDDTYNLLLQTDYFAGRDGSFRGYGFSLRCLAR